MDKLASRSPLGGRRRNEGLDRGTSGLSVTRLGSSHISLLDNPTGPDGGTSIKPRQTEVFVRLRRQGILVSALAALGIVAGSVVAAAPASAESCINQDQCLYYNSNGDGAFYRVPWDIPNLSDTRFNACGHSCAGLGELVWNNAASARNTSDSWGMTVFYRFEYKGAYDVIYLNSLQNLVNTYNEDASVLVRVGP
ncbi:peptidase inhibitor family I36 protein [Streptomyces melanogenes]|uniref:peptidase inhibitor family I36 protein n=1 Tax=Streptomyces melanogenes TaxID=67326 RepID=UPI0037A50814